MEKIVSNVTSLALAYLKCGFAMERKIAVTRERMKNRRCVNLEQDRASMINFSVTTEVVCQRNGFVIMMEIVAITRMKAVTAVSKKLSQFDVSRLCKQRPPSITPLDCFRQDFVHTKNCTKNFFVRIHACRQSCAHFLEMLHSMTPPI